MADVSGVIAELEGDYAVVRLDDDGAGCGRCHEPGGCGGRNIGKMFCSTPRTYRVLNPGGAKVGALVTIVIAEGAVRRSAALAYAMPLCGLFIGTFAGSAMFGEPGALVGALVGLLVAWIILYRVNRSRWVGDRFQPYIRP